MWSGTSQSAVEVRSALLAARPGRHDNEREDRHEDQYEGRPRAGDRSPPGMAAPNDHHGKQAADSHTRPEHDAHFGTARARPTHGVRVAPYFATRVRGGLPEHEGRHAADDRPAQDRRRRRGTNRQLAPGKSGSDRRAQPDRDDDRPAECRAIQWTDIQETVTTHHSVGESNHGKRSSHGEPEAHLPIETWAIGVSPTARHRLLSPDNDFWYTIRRQDDYEGGSIDGEAGCSAA